MMPNKTMDVTIKAPKVASTTMPLRRCLSCDSTNAADASCISVVTPCMAVVTLCMSAAALAAMPAARLASSAESSMAERMAIMSSSSPSVSP